MQGDGPAHIIAHLGRYTPGTVIVHLVYPTSLDSGHKLTPDNVGYLHLCHQQGIYSNSRDMDRNPAILHHTPVNLGASAIGYQYHFVANKSIFPKNRPKLQRISYICQLLFTPTIANLIHITSRPITTRYQPVDKSPRFRLINDIDKILSSLRAESVAFPKQSVGIALY